MSEPIAAASIESLESRKLLSALRLESTFNDGARLFGPLGTVVKGQNFAPLLLQSVAHEKILAVGTARDESSHNFVGLARFNKDGSRDSTFAGHGLRVAERIYSVADALVQPDGKILVVGCDQSMFMARYTADGALDTTFGGGDGIAPIAHVDGVRVERANAVCVQPDGKILV